MTAFYASTLLEIQKVVDALWRARDLGYVPGLDTEFYNVDLGKQSCYARSRMHLMSVGVQRYPVQYNARGIPLVDGAVFTADILENKEVVSWLESDAPKAIQNSPVDIHTLANHGIVVGGGLNTLDYARWAWPERARGRGFTLDSLGEDFLGMGKTEGYEDIFTEEYEALRSTFRKVRVCECGQAGCRKRQSTEGHRRSSQSVETIHASTKTRPVQLEAVKPGHALWERAVSYAARDAVMAASIYWLAIKTMSETHRVVPWL